MSTATRQSVRRGRRPNTRRTHPDEELVVSPARTQVPRNTAVSDELRASASGPVALFSAEGDLADNMPNHLRSIDARPDLRHRFRQAHRAGAISSYSLIVRPQTADRILWVPSSLETPGHHRQSGRRQRSKRRNLWAVGGIAENCHRTDLQEHD